MMTRKKPTKRSFIARKTPVKRKRSKPRRERHPMNPDPAPIRDPGHLKFVRTMPCSARSLGKCWGRRHAHHADWDRGHGMKNGDDMAWCLCAKHHGEWHDKSGNGAFGDWSHARKIQWGIEEIARTQVLAHLSMVALEADRILP